MKIMNFFYGRYGFDILSLFLILISGLFGCFRITKSLSFLLNIYVLYRAFSRNIYMRNTELNWFTSKVNKILGRFGKSLPYALPRASLDVIPQSYNVLKSKIQQKLKYKIVKCPNCKQKLRLPRGQKKIIVTCKRCKTEFKMRT